MEQSQDNSSNFEFSIIQPRNMEELTKSIEILSSLGMLVKKGNSQYETLLNSQKNYISRYIDSIGRFDNSQLIANINFLLKKYGVRIGELEQIIGVSPGYISRTAKDKSQKKLSIDTVWKLAKLFETPLEELLDSELSVPRDNTRIISAFIKKLLHQTQTNRIEWRICGGGMCEPDEKLRKLGLITFDEDDELYVYHSEHLNPENTWIITSDVVALEEFYKNRSLLVIPYTVLRKNNKDSYAYSPYAYDFILVWEDSKGVYWEKFFYTSEDAKGELTELSSKLMRVIQNAWYAAKISVKNRLIIENFLNN